MKFSDQQYERYSRQMLLPELGEKGQQKLLQAKVLVIGAGGLGCAALPYLTAGGIGTIGIADNDTVALHNLHRQVLYRTADIGLSKTTCAAAYIKRINPEINIIEHHAFINNTNAIEIFSAYDVIIDCTDNFPSRYLVNDACVLLNKPLVFAAISAFEAQLAIFNVADEKNMAINYRDLFPEPISDAEVLNCAEGGILGVLAGITGCMQANETIKLLAGIGKPLLNSLLTFNALNNQVYKIKIVKHPLSAKLIPHSIEAFQQTDYVLLCNKRKQSFEINADTFNTLIQNENVIVVDVREPGEQPSIASIQHINIPLHQLQQRVVELNADNIVTVCKTGARSLKAAQTLSDIFGTTKKVFSLKGGIIHYKLHTHD